MIQDILTRQPMIIYPLISLIIFCTWFILTLIWLFRKNSHEFYRKMGALAVDDAAADPSCNITEAAND